MQKAELQIILRLLQDKKAVNENYRKIAAEACTSVGSVHTTMKNLTGKGYVIESDGKRLLRKRNALIDRWVSAYCDGLKDRYLVMRFTFLTPEVRDRWRDIALPDTFCWGGEPAAAIIDGYLQPQKWDIYASAGADMLIATRSMIPNPYGEIYVYKKFWNADETPALVVYADLMATDNDRCIEAAERIKSLI